MNIINTLVYTNIYVKYTQIVTIILYTCILEKNNNYIRNVRTKHKCNFENVHNQNEF